MKTGVKVRTLIFLLAVAAATALSPSPASAGWRWMCISPQSWDYIVCTTPPGVVPGWYASISWHDPCRGRGCARSQLIKAQCGWVWGPDGAVASYRRDGIRVGL